MMRRLPCIGALNRQTAAEELELSALRDFTPSGAIVFADHRNGIRLVWEVMGKKPRGINIQPHEARALSEAFAAAADDIAPYKVKP
jgi:hypothetical protein